MIFIPQCVSSCPVGTTHFHTRLCPSRISDWRSVYHQRGLLQNILGSGHLLCKSALEAKTPQCHMSRGQNFLNYGNNLHDKSRIQRKSKEIKGNCKSVFRQPGRQRISSYLRSEWLEITWEMARDPNELKTEDLRASESSEGPEKPKKKLRSWVTWRTERLDMTWNDLPWLDMTWRDLTFRQPWRGWEMALGIWDALLTA